MRKMRRISELWMMMMKNRRSGGRVEDEGDWQEGERAGKDDGVGGSCFHSLGDRVGLGSESKQGLMASSLLFLFVCPDATLRSPPLCTKM